MHTLIRVNLCLLFSSSWCQGSSSWCQRLAVTSACGSSWTFLFTFLTLAGVIPTAQALEKILKNWPCSTLMPVVWVKSSTSLFNAVLSGLNTVWSNGCVQLLILLGSSTMMILLSLAKVINSVVLCALCLWQIRSWGRSGSVLGRNVWVNHSFPIPSFVHLLSDTEKLAPLRGDWLSFDSRSYPCSFFSVLPGIIRCAGRAFPSALPQAITVIIPGRIHVVSSPFYLVLSDVPAGLSPLHYHRLLL